MYFDRFGESSWFRWVEHSVRDFSSSLYASLVDSPLRLLRCSPKIEGQTWSSSRRGTGVFTKDSLDENGFRTEFWISHTFVYWFRLQLFEFEWFEFGDAFKSLDRAFFDKAVRCQVSVCGIEPDQSIDSGVRSRTVWTHSDHLNHLNWTCQVSFQMSYSGCSNGHLNHLFKTIKTIYSLTSRIDWHLGSFAMIYFRTSIRLFGIQCNWASWTYLDYPKRLCKETMH